MRWAGCWPAPTVRPTWRAGWRIIAPLPAAAGRPFRAVRRGLRASVRDRTQVLEADGVPSDLARRLAAIEDAGGLFDMLGIARHCEADPEKVAALYFEVGDRLSLQWLQQAIQGLAAEGRWQALARASLRDDCYRAHARLVADILIPRRGGIARYRRLVERAGQPGRVRGAAPERNCVGPSSPVSSICPSRCAIWPAWCPTSRVADAADVRPHGLARPALVGG